ncbi:Periplasmic glucans biosynthesis protein mdoG precursor [Granulibacter bethesdensis]|nr:Periplasmic glucans biosynthesis protein mdoG precursor [Granulibacter bethesdensis]
MPQRSRLSPRPLSSWTSPVLRRVILRQGMAAGLASLGLSLRPSLAGQVTQPTSFDVETLEEMARTLASLPYVPPSQQLPETLAGLDYERYGKIRFLPDHALWHGRGERFEAEFFHRGYLFKDRVAINEIVNGISHPIRYNPAWFDLGDISPPEDDIGLAGFRILARFPGASPRDRKEIAVFLGASYFRAVAPGQNFGLSARGLALGSGENGAEEFPVFREFWLERPQQDADHLVIYALLDSPSLTGAFRFVLRSDVETVMDVDSVLFPRRDIANIGIAPLTSMFWFDPSYRVGVDDYRQAVHDSDGLLIHTGAGETIWRSLADPAQVQLSSFADHSPRGFGLMQRQRGFDAYEDIGARYDLRPSAWVEPDEDWGEGAVHLAELPTGTEFQDNIVAFWRPTAPLKGGQQYRYAYRLRWCDDISARTLARVVAFRAGASADPKRRFFMLDLAGGDLRADERMLDAMAPPASPRQLAAMLVPEVICSAGQLKWAEIKRIPAYPVASMHGMRRSGVALYRVGFELEPGDASLVDLTVRVRRGRKVVSETWMYRWTAKDHPRP